MKDPSSKDGSADTPPFRSPVDPSDPSELGQSFDELVQSATSSQGTDRLALLRLDQHRRWQRGQCVLAEVYLQRLPLLAQEEDMAVDLIYSEFVLRRQLGEQIDLEEYVSRFPLYGPSLKEQFQLQKALGEDLTVGSLVPPSSGEGSPTPHDWLPLHSGPTADSDPSATLGKSVPGYEILEVLGRGGMGVVYKARHLRENRLVALKMILAGVHARPEQLSRLRAEAEVLERLRHPHIVTICEIGQHDGLPYFSMEYVSGGTLADRNQAGRLPPGEAARLIEILARAMHEAHSLGVIHRDLKPANVLLDERGTPRITDFGVAKRLDEKMARLTRSGALVGTPVYMSPEQATGGRDAGPTADVYSLGAVLYELLTGQPPFHHPEPPRNVLEALDRVRFWEPAPPRSLHPGTPEQLETICLVCLRKDPAQRYASAKLLAEDCAAYLRGLPIRGVLPCPAPRPRRDTVKSLFWVALFAIALAVTLSALVILKG